MKNKANEILNTLTLEEKIHLLTGSANMATNHIEEKGVPEKKFADGPHGIRIDYEHNCTSMPNLCSVGATWDKELTEEMGEALAKDCIEHGIDMLLGPGVNIKRHILCGRNFEYVSEDPLVAGEIGASYIKGLQKLGIAACLKHFALNNQEKYRQSVSVDVDERTLRELYLKPFEIAVKKSAPASVMCAYNKLHSIWCSENEFLLTKVLRDEWGYEGFVVSDWGAVHDMPRALKAGLDLQMPANHEIQQQMKEGIDEGRVSEKDIDKATLRMLEFMLKERTEKLSYDRDAQHALARKIAAAGCVLLKNDNDVLPITKEKYRKVAVIGEFGKEPLICGQGSAEVKVRKEYIDSPLEELRKILGDDVEVKYKEMYKKAEFSPKMLWGTCRDLREFIEECDIVLMFVGAMESEDTENFDRRTAELNRNYEMFIESACDSGKKVVVINQSGSAMIFGDWKNHADAIVQMWLAGEGAGGGVADILCGKVNPSGRLPETFPVKMRRDLEYPGNERFIEYRERLDVGYRYYDKHPEEIAYPFGHGLSYTKFEYSDIQASFDEKELCVSFTLENTGKTDGAEVVQIYTGDPVSTVVRPEKELKAFSKVFLKTGEKKTVTLKIDIADMGYYNVLLHKWVTEPGRYDVYVGASSRDIRLKKAICYEENAPYTMNKKGESMIG